MTLEAALAHLRDLLNAHHFDDALAFLSHLESEQVDKGAVHCMRGSLYDTQGEFHLAEIEYRKALTYPQSRLHPQAMSRHADVLEDLGRAAEALKEAQQVVRLYPGYPEGCGVLGRLLHNRGRHHEAVPLLETAHNAEPTNRRVYGALIRSLYFAGLPFEGRAKLQQILDGDDDYWNYLIVLADDLFAAEHYESALELFLFHFNTRPWDTEIIPKLIYAAQELKEVGRVESVARELVAKNGRPVAALLVLAEAAFLSGCYDEVHALLEELLAVERPNDWAVQSLVARVALQEARYPDAYRTATEVLRLREDIDYMRSVAGAAAAAMEMDREAVELLRSYFERNEPEAWLMYNLGVSELSLGNFSEACAAMEYCIQENLADYESRRIYASALHGLGRLQEAKQQYDQCVTHDPDDRESLYGLMFVLEEMGEKDHSKRLADYIVRIGYRTDTPEFKEVVEQNQWRF